MSALQERRFDVLVIGGGINGAAAAQHLAAEGYSVLLVEKGDFASAATGRSTRILHWGIRYLAPEKSPWEFLRHPIGFLKKFRESLVLAREYEEFRSSTPDYLNSYPVFVPFFKNGGVSGWQLDIAALLLGARRKSSSTNYRRYSGRAARDLEAARLIRDHSQITQLLEFEDCQFAWPERMCLDALLDAQRMGACIRNYTRVSGLEYRDGRWSALLEGGDEAASANVWASAIVNTTGVWVDELLRMAAGNLSDKPTQKAVGIKGIHFMAKLPPEFDGKIIVGRNRSNTQLSCIPWRGLHYFGPTEVPYQGDIENVSPTDEEVTFLVNEANHFFPGLGLKMDQVRFAWAGVRAKTYHPEHSVGDPAGTARIHDLSLEGLPKLFTLTWGTINQHRLTARRLVEAVKGVHAPSGKAKPLSYQASINRKALLAGEQKQRSGKLDLSCIVEIARTEYPRTLVDILFRRVDLAWGPFLSGDEVRSIAEAVAPVLHWNAERVSTEVESFVGYMRHQHRYEVPMSAEEQQSDDLSSSARNIAL
ncbi:FAD-dependent oxidoreductase [Mesorhizobium sp.]|uniref:FAD-dependent oxidoreductase n=1 Tax=Mesorhizobium sp. TaxID=1871066 RepID=UPI0025BC4A82|nr:FAD-dependent oxidoreductase [Mesorhizobium sp.]